MRSYTLTLASLTHTVSLSGKKPLSLVCKLIRLSINDARKQLAQLEELATVLEV